MSAGTSTIAGSLILSMNPVILRKLATRAPDRRWFARAGDMGRDVEVAKAVVDTRAKRDRSCGAWRYGSLSTRPTKRRPGQHNRRHPVR